MRPADTIGRARGLHATSAAVAAIAAAAPRHAFTPVTRQIAWALLVAAVLAYMLLSASALYLLGIPYDVPFGPFPAKIHPGSYLLVAAWCLGLASHGNPLAVAAQQARQFPLLMVYLLCMVAVFAWALGRHGPAGLAFMIETLWMPAIAALAAALHTHERQRRLLHLLLLLLAANAVVAMAEFGLGRWLVPVGLGEALQLQNDFFRANALLGHPLLNALVTVSLLPAVSLLRWRLRWRLALGVLLALALLSFGGRSAIAAAAIYALLALGPLLRGVLAGHHGYRQVSGGLLTLMAGCAALVGVVAATGLGERFFKNLKWDNSAAVRLRIYDMLDHVHDADLWVGVSVAQIEHIALRVGLDLRYEAVENFWLYLLLLLGVVGFVPFVLGFGALLAHLWRSAGPAMRMGLVAYVVIASGANTLASKSVSLLLLTLAVQCAAQRQPGRLTFAQNRQYLRNWPIQYAAPRDPIQQLHRPPQPHRHGPMVPGGAPR